MTGFQKQVNQYAAVAVEGDFASANPRRSVLAGDGALVAGADGVTVGRFAWARNDDGVVSNNHPGYAARLGFVQRDQVSIITGWLAQDTMLVPAGIEVTLFDGGDFWARFANGASIGQSVYVNTVSGLAIAGAANSVPTSGDAVVTASIGASVTGITGVSATGKVGGAVTGAISGNVLTVSAVTASTKLQVGDLLSGPGGSSDPIDDGTTIVNQLTGTAGGTGTYTVSIAQTSTSATITVQSSVVTITAIAAGAPVVGTSFTGTGWPAGTAITSQLTGTAGGVGDYQLDVDPFAAASTALTAPSNTLTVSAVGAGALHVGDILAGTGVPTGQTITALGTGTGGTGTYTVSTSDYSASGTITSTSDVMDVTAVTSGTLAAGMTLSGTSVDSGTILVAQLTGAVGGIGTYRVTPAQAADSTTITGAGAVATSWYVESNAGNGELAKISTRT